MPNLDYTRALFEGLIDTVVSTVMPKFTCSDSRWLTFELEALTEEGEAFRWRARFRARWNYVDWETSFPDGTVIDEGSHDSCWRGHGMKLDGHPRIEETWKDDEGNEHKTTKPTTHFDKFKARTVRVHSVSIQGPAAEHSKIEVKDGVWVNPDPEGLTGIYALLVALGSLAHCADRPAPLTIPLDTSLRYFRDAKQKDLNHPKLNRKHHLVATMDRRKTQWVQIDAEGRVCAFASPDPDRPSRPATWTRCDRKPPMKHLAPAWRQEPFVLTRELFLQHLPGGVRRQGAEGPRRHREGLGTVHPRCRRVVR